MFLININDEEFTHGKEWITGREIFQKLKISPKGNQIAQHFRFGRKEEVQLDEKVDLAPSAVERFKIGYKFTINGQQFIHDNEWINGKQLLDLLGISKLEGNQVIQKFRYGREEKVELNEKVDLATEGVEKFEIGFLVKIDKTFVLFFEKEVEGKQLLARVGKKTATDELKQKLKSKQLVTIKPDDIVDLSKPGIEKFITLPLDQTEGYVTNNTFILPEEDRAFLTTFPYKCETHKEGNIQWLIIRDYPIPEGYNHEKSDIALLIPSNYPQGQIDMVYFSNSLQRLDGKTIKATQSHQSIQGKSWQRWSRHRTGKNPWRVGIDDISTHLELVNNWLVREFKK